MHPFPFTSEPVEWRVSNGLIDYAYATQFMEERVEKIYRNQTPEMIWLVEHPPLYTVGTSGKEGDLLAPHLFPVFSSNRGGQYTYHGPGQRVVYIMLDLTKRAKDIHLFIHALEDWIIHTLAHFNIRGEKRNKRIGVWVVSNHSIPSENKIAAIGIRLRHWISFHGISINISPNLAHFSGIVPCGLTEYGVTSCKTLGKEISMHDFDIVLHQTFQKMFGPTYIQET